MRKIIICLLTLFALTSVTAYAGPGHSHSHGPVTPITKEQAMDKATDLLKSFAEKGKIDSTWSEATPVSGEQQKGKFGEEWVVVFKNPKIEDAEKQTIYIFMTLGGEYKVANYTGS